MDPAETLRAALTRQHQARKNYEEARSQESSPEESPKQRAKRLEDLREAAEAAEAEMMRLRPPEQGAGNRIQEDYSPPMGPLSN